MPTSTHTIEPARIEESIQLLRNYIHDSEINAFTTILEEMKQDPQSESLLEQLADAFNNLGITQGAVLTYAPYISILLSNNLFGDD